MRNPAKVRKIENRSIQLVILVITYWFIYNQIFQKTDLPGIVKSFGKDLTQPDFKSKICLLIGMMILNWSIEAVKWKMLIGKIEKVSFFKSLQGVLTGISISSFTPNRVGDFFGRAFILRKASHVEGILVTVLGSMAQLLITVLVGSAALMVFLPGVLPKALFSHGYLYMTILALVMLLDLLLLAMFFNVAFLATLKEKILRNGLKKIRRFFRVFAFYHNRELAITLLLSFMRYAVFSTQFYILLRMFDVRLPFFDALVLIALTYLIMAVIPTIALTELGIRGSVALYVFGLYFNQNGPASHAASLGIFSASTLLWLINLGIPALIGTFFVFRLQFFRKED